MVAVAAAVLSGCSGNDQRVSAPPTTETPTPTPTYIPPAVPPPPTVQAPTGPITLSKSMAKPGTRLRFGQRAVVPVQVHPMSGATVDGVIGLAVGKIRRTKVSNLEGNFDSASRARMKGKTLFYAEVVVTNLGTQDLTGLYFLNFHGLLSGQRQPPLGLIGGDLAGCGDDTLSVRGKGSRSVYCVLTVANASDPVTTIAYDGPPYGVEIEEYGQPKPQYNNYYDLGAITWR